MARKKDVGGQVTHWPTVWEGGGGGQDGYRGQN